jgi:hypothetical protein
MANYQLKYQCLFDSLESEPYTIQILQKDYTGQPINVTGGATPVLQEWQTDDPKAPIKGSSLSITLINDGSLPLQSFYSVDDDTFKVVLLWGTKTLFEGFLVQDDCEEPVLDYTHEINLSANDNLGLLKDLSLDKADASFVYTYIGLIPFSSVTPHTLNISNTAGSQLQPGDKIKIVGGDADGIYTAQSVTAGTGNFAVVVVEEIPTVTGNEPLYIGKIALLDKKPLINIIMMCLSLTDLQLNLNVWGQINEVSQDQTKCFLEQTLIDPQTFLKDAETYDDCYTVLTKILSAFNFTLFQSLGAWHMVRWDELRYFNNRVPAYVYNYDASFNGYSLLQAPFDAGFNRPTYPETGLLQRIIRPFAYNKETFNFKQPIQLLRNYDLKTLGTLLRSYNIPIWIKGGQIYYSNPGGTGVTTSFQKIKEYSILGWQVIVDTGNTGVTQGYAFIRITFDDIDNEIDRIVVLKQAEITSYPIEVNKGDIFVYSFSFKTQKSQTGGNGFGFRVYLTDGATINEFYTQNGDSPPGWYPQDNFRAWTYEIPDGDNSNVWHTVTIDTTLYPIPFDGLLVLDLPDDDLGGPFDTHQETYYKDIRLDYTPLINQTTKIIGQTHETNQIGNVKNNSDTEIFVDSSPRNSIIGTLFLNEMNGVIQKRTVKWRHPYLNQSENLGNLITFEEMFWRRKPRTILEGTLYGLIRDVLNPYGCSILVTIDPLHDTEHISVSWTSVPAGCTGVNVSYFDGVWHDNPGSTTSPRTFDLTGGNYVFKVSFTGTDEVFYFSDFNDHFSLISVLNYAQFSGFNFVAGRLSIDFKNNKFTGTLYEIWDDGEQDSDLTDTYQFNYLYDPI